MNTCTICGYKQVKNSVFEQHLLTHQVDKPVEVVPEATVPPTPVAPEPVQMVTDEITIRFTKPVEIQINGIHYDGKEVVVKNMSIASEIVRLAREAYGPQILA